MVDRKDLLSISEMAKLRKVTAETLRHYDRIDLFKPSYIDEENGYRYYSIRQYEVLGTIKELRQLGMSLDEIKAYFDNRTVHETIELLKKRHEILLKEIEEKNALEKIIANKLLFLDEMQKNPCIGCVFERDLPERYMLTTQGFITNNTRDMCLEITKLESCMEEVAPVFASDRVGSLCAKNITEITDRFDISPFVLCEKKYKKADKFQKIPGGKYLCIYYNGRFGHYSESFELVKDYMKEHSLTQNGCFYQTYEIDITVTSNFDETLVLLQIPVKKID